MKINNTRLDELANISRKNSIFNIPFRHQTTIYTGDLVPVFNMDVLPGDNINFDDVSIFARMTTPIFPVMDSAYLDVYFFYVPFRIVYENFEQFLGASDDDEYGIQEKEYFMPSVYDITYSSRDIASYFNLPVDININDSNAINICNFRAYTKIYNEWFRNENLVEPFECKEIYESFDYETNESSLSDVSKLQYGKGIARVSKLADLFTKALPFTQNGPSVQFNFSGFKPIIENGTEFVKNNYDAVNLQNIPEGSNYQNLTFFGSELDDNTRLSLYKTQGYYGVGKLAPSSALSDANGQLYISNLGVENNISFSINDLRIAFQMQRFYEQLARSGTRFNEFIKGIFDVDILDATVQRPQLICSKRYNINMQQVVQTSSTDEVSPQGNVSGLSNGLYRVENMGNISIREPGTIIGLICVRTNHTYTNVIPKEFSKLRKFDYYYPQFQAIGEQGIKNKEIYFSGNSIIDNRIFGYQEAWYEYRNKISYASGEFKSASGAYAPYTYADYFSKTPVLNSNFILENDTNMKRTLAVQDGPDFLIDFFTNIRASRPLPLYSVPGLIDHF